VKVNSIQIEKAGIDTWMDKGRLRPGQDWSDEIDQAIRHAYALILIMSPEAKTSEYVAYEWSFALGAGVQVIPVLYRETALHPRLARLHYLPFTNPRVRPWDELINAVKDIVSTSDLYPVRVPRNAPPYVKRAVLELDSANTGDREGAVSLLAQSDHPTAREALISALQHPIPPVRWAAALHVVEDERAIPVLIDMLTNADATQRKFARAHISKFGQVAITALMDILQNSTERNADAIAYGLGNFEYDDLIPLLLSMLDDPRSHVRRAAILGISLSKHKQHLIEKIFITATDDPDTEVRLEAVRGLFSNRSPDQGHFIHLGQFSHEELFKLLQDRSFNVRKEAEERLLDYLLTLKQNVPNDHRITVAEEKIYEIAQGEHLCASIVANRLLLRVSFNRKLYHNIHRPIHHTTDDSVNVYPGEIFYLFKSLDNLGQGNYVFIGEGKQYLKVGKIIEGDETLSVSAVQRMRKHSYWRGIPESAILTNLTIDIHAKE
jgi:hypothetical protein